MGNSLRQTVHFHRASVHQTAKLVAALLRVAGVTAGLAESNGCLPPGLRLTSPAGWLPRTGISSGTLRSAIEYWLPLIFYFWLFTLSQKKTICNPLAHPTWKCTTLTCEVPNFFYLTEGLHCTCIFRTCVFHPCEMRCFVLAFSVYWRCPVLAFSAPPYIGLSIVSVYSSLVPYFSVNKDCQNL